MGATKAGPYTMQHLSIAHLAKALAHPARIAILQHLSEQNKCQCGELASVIGLAQPTISQHLKELKQAGLIKGAIGDSGSCYCISGQATGDLIRFLEEIKSSSDSLEIADCC